MSRNLPYDSAYEIFALRVLEALERNHKDESSAWHCYRGVRAR